MINLNDHYPAEQVHESAREQGMTMTVLALQPTHVEWCGTAAPPGGVLEATEVSLTPEGWQTLIKRLAPVPPFWPSEVPDGLDLRVVRMELATDRGSPERFDEDGWLYLCDGEETSALATWLFNPNGMHFINHARPWRYADSWPDRVARIKDFLERQGLSASRVVIDSSLVLELYGIRRARDIDYLSLDEAGGREKPFSANDAQLEHHGLGKQALIEDPAHHFEVDGLRFISFTQLRRLKRGRNRLKDRNDLAMMAALEDGREWRLVAGRGIAQCLVAVSILRRGPVRLLRYLVRHARLRQLLGR